MSEEPTQEPVVEEPVVEPVVDNATQIASLREELAAVKAAQTQNQVPQQSQTDIEYAEYFKQFEDGAITQPTVEDETEMEKMQRSIGKLEKMQIESTKMQQRREQASVQQQERNALIAEYARTVPDWKEIEEEVLIVADQVGVDEHGKSRMTDNEIIEIARARKLGSGKKPIKKKSEADKPVEYEKPNGSGPSTDKSFGSVRSAAAQSFREIVANAETNS